MVKTAGMAAIVLVSALGLVYINLKYFTPRFKIYQADEAYLTAEKISQAAKAIPEYLPRWASVWPEEKPAQAVETEEGKVEISLDSPYKITFRVEGKKPEEIIVNRFYFPGWQVKGASEEKIILEPEKEKGRILLTSGIGENEEITLFFAPTLAEKIGITFSILGLILLLVVVFIKNYIVRRRELTRIENEWARRANEVVE